MEINIKCHSVRDFDILNTAVIGSDVSTQVHFVVVRKKAKFEYIHMRWPLMEIKDNRTISDHDVEVTRDMVHSADMRHFQREELQLENRNGNSKN